MGKGQPVQGANRPSYIMLEKETHVELQSDNKHTSGHEGARWSQNSNRPKVNMMIEKYVTCPKM